LLVGVRLLNVPKHAFVRVRPTGCRRNCCRPHRHERARDRQGMVWRHRALPRSLLTVAAVCRPHRYLPPASDPFTHHRPPHIRPMHVAAASRPPARAAAQPRPRPCPHHHGIYNRLRHSSMLRAGTGAACGRPATRRCAATSMRTGRCGSLDNRRWETKPHRFGSARPFVPMAQLLKSLSHSQVSQRGVLSCLNW
jgi:hypothetical protein